MPKQDLKHILPKIYHAAEACKQRLVVAVGSHSYPSPHPDVWMAAGDLPHPLIFKKVTAVLHHGGAGTTATVARAGVPQILVPHVLDQFFWADRVFRLGIGPRMTERSRLSSKNLIASLRAVAAYDGFHQRARSIAQHINRFDSLNSAVRLIESGKVWT